MVRCVIETILADPKCVDEVVLRMTVEEARVLRQILGAIGGDPTGPHGVLDEIVLALNRAGVKQTRHKIEINYGLGGNYLHIEKGE